jgi:hypothetical protein
MTQRSMRCKPPCQPVLNLGIAVKLDRMVDERGVNPRYFEDMFITDVVPG